MGDERDEVGPELREARELLDPSPLGLVGADVLHRGRDEAAEQRDELDLVLAERVGPVAREAEHPDRAGAEQEWRHQLAAQTEREELLVGGRVPLLEVAAHDHLSLEHALEQRALDRVAVPGREDLVRTAAGGRHRRRGVALDEDDRRPLEGKETAQLADERAERLVELERRAEGARAAVRGLEDVDAVAQLVAQPFRLGGARLGATAARR